VEAGHEIRNALAGLRQVFEYQPDRGRTVVSQVNFGNSDATAPSPPSTPLCSINPSEM
jgi:hypothetical protein